MIRISAIFIALTLTLVSAEETIDRPLPPDQAAAEMEVPEGFSVSLFAGEPDLVQPVDFCIDDRGRLWVAEALSYPKHTDEPAQDRITIFEDTDNDGQHDKRTVFYDKLNYVTGIEVGFGGAWVMSPPHFFFIPDRDGDNVPDGEPEIVLDGFGNHANSHNLANGFEWGPDGWLYASHGRTNWSLIGKPGTPEEKRTRFDGGIWRFDPVTHEWESFCDGTTNPWGIDWDQYGEAFMTNCVNPHLYHAIQGAHYEPWRGRKSSQHAYRRIETIADHLHYAGSDHFEFDSDETRDLGGGHAHCGVLVYPENGPWPEKYRGAIFLNNIHGDRINREFLKRNGSGYTASHAPDFMFSKDPWFMGVCLQLAPDGSIFVSDWSDTGECHSTRNTRKETGRIFKISFGKPEMPELNLAEKSTDQLVDLAMSKNRFIERHARRILWERTSREPTGLVQRTDPVASLKAKFEAAEKDTEKLKALWALRCTSGLDDTFLLPLLDSNSEHIQSWAIRLMFENNERGPLNEGESNNKIRDRLQEISNTGTSQKVILNLISASMRMPVDDRWELLRTLASRPADENDPNLSLMLWYAIEDLFEIDPMAFVEFTRSENPVIRRFAARRAASEPAFREKHFSLLFEASKFPQYGEIKEAFEGILDGLEGVRQIDAPDNWEEAKFWATRSSMPGIDDVTMKLGLKFNDPGAVNFFESRAVDSAEAAELRLEAIEILIQKKPENLDSTLLKLIGDKAVGRTAIRGLAAFNSPGIADRLLQEYASLNSGSKSDALQTLASRKKWAAQLLDALQAGTVKRTDMTAFTARQIVNLKDKTLTERVSELWGDLKSTSAEKEKQMASWRKKLKPESIKESDPKAGRLHFQKLCASCHKMFGDGGMVGPELTGSQRNNIDYLLENLIDPSASVSKDFQMHVIETTDGRTLSGFVESDAETALTLRSINEKVVIPRKEIKTDTVSGVSIMPEGLLNVLSVSEVRELVAYLASPSQVSIGQ